MPHGLDHIVHAVRDLDAAGEFYSSAGFTVGGRNRHPWGTHNRIVQLKNCYIELLEVAEPEEIPPHGERSFSFGAFNRDFLRAAGFFDGDPQQHQRRRRRPLVQGLKNIRFRIVQFRARGQKAGRNSREAGLLAGVCQRHQIAACALWHVLQSIPDRS